MTISFVPCVCSETTRDFNPDLTYSSRSPCAYQPVSRVEHPAYRRRLDNVILDTKSNRMLELTTRDEQLQPTSNMKRACPIFQILVRFVPRVLPNILCDIIRSRSTYSSSSHPPTRKGYGAETLLVCSRFSSDEYPEKNDKRFPGNTESTTVRFSILVALSSSAEDARELEL